jgi:hypothetical protein
MVPPWQGSAPRYNWWPNSINIHITYGYISFGSGSHSSWMPRRTRCNERHLDKMLPESVDGGGSNACTIRDLDKKLHVYIFSGMHVCWADELATTSEPCWGVPLLNGSNGIQAYVLLCLLGDRI